MSAWESVTSWLADHGAPWSPHVNLELDRRPPEFRVDQLTAAGTPSDGMNEGWRFAVGYAIVMVISLLHFGLQKAGCLPPPITDNGVKGGPGDMEPSKSLSASASAESATA